MRMRLRGEKRTRRWGREKERRKSEWERIGKNGWVAKRKRSCKKEERMMSRECDRNQILWTNLSQQTHQRLSNSTRAEQQDPLKSLHLHLGCKREWRGRTREREGERRETGRREKGEVSRDREEGKMWGEGWGREGRKKTEKWECETWEKWKEEQKGIYGNGDSREGKPEVRNAAVGDRVRLDNKRVECIAVKQEESRGRAMRGQPICGDKRKEILYYW
jgi:hypothetical protein